MNRRTCGVWVAAKGGRQAGTEFSQCETCFPFCLVGSHGLFVSARKMHSAEALMTTAAFSSFRQPPVAPQNIPRLPQLCGCCVAIWADDHMAVKTVLGSHFGWLVNSPPILEPIWDVHWGSEILTHGHISFSPPQYPLTTNHGSEQEVC